MENLVAAAKAIIHQRDYFAENGEYDRTQPNPDAELENGIRQCFDDWAADILEAALNP